MSSEKVYLIGAKRSAIGSFLGALKDTHPSDFGSQVLRKLLADTNIPVDKIDEVIVGNVLQAGVGQGLGRQISIKSGIPVTVPAYSINMVCGSGMKSVMNAYTAIKAGLGNLIVAGGIESMSQAPYLISSNARYGTKMGNMEMSDVILKDGLVDAFTNTHMGITAENVAEKYGISREEQDEFAYNSQVKTIKAIDDGLFKDEIIPIEIKTRKETIVFDQDEYPNRNTNLDKISKLRPAFKSDGLVTAASSSGINDGASFIIVASEKAVNEYGLTPIAELIAVGQGGVEPNVMGLGPVPAIKQALENANMKLNDIEVIELNEAFASQSIGVILELSDGHGLTRKEILSRTNVRGGAISLGHPVGMSGNRIIVTLLHEMKRNNNKFGLASLCIGGGMGTAVIIKNI